MTRVSGRTTTQMASPVTTKAARHPKRLMSAAEAGAQTRPPSPAPTASSDKANDSRRANHLAMMVKADM